MDEIAESCTRCGVMAKGGVFVCDSPRKVFARAEEISALGLDIPVTAKIAREMKKAGYEIDIDLTVSGFTEAVISAFGGAENA